MPKINAEDKGGETKVYSDTGPECPFCGAPSGKAKPKELRDDNVDGLKYRVRNYTCGGLIEHTFSTIEKYKTRRQIKIKKVKHDDLVDFDLDNVAKGIKKAVADGLEYGECRKLSTEVESALCKMESTVDASKYGFTKYSGKLFNSRDVGEEALRVLWNHGLHVAWIRFSLVFYKGEVQKLSYDGLKGFLDCKRKYFQGE